MVRWRVVDSMSTEVPPSRVGHAALESRDDLLGQHHVVGVAEQGDDIARKPRQLAGFGRWPDRVAEVDVDVDRDSRTRQSRFEVNADPGVVDLVTTRTIRRRISAGDLPAQKLGRKAIRIKIADLDRIS